MNDFCQTIKVYWTCMNLKEKVISHSTSCMKNGGGIYPMQIRKPLTRGKLSSIRFSICLHKIFLNMNAFKLQAK